MGSVLDWVAGSLFLIGSVLFVRIALAVLHGPDE